MSLKGRLGKTHSEQIMYMPAKSLQSCLTLCDPIDCSPAGSSVHGILQARTLGWVAMPFSWGSSSPSDQTLVPGITGGFSTAEPLGKPRRLWGGHFFFFFTAKKVGQYWRFLSSMTRSTPFLPCRSLVQPLWSASNLTPFILLPTLYYHSLFIFNSFSFSYLVLIHLVLDATLSLSDSSFFKMSINSF